MAGRKTKSNAVRANRKANQGYGARTRKKAFGAETSRLERLPPHKAVSETFRENPRVVPPPRGKIDDERYDSKNSDPDPDEYAG